MFTYLSQDLLLTLHKCRWTSSVVRAVASKQEWTVSFPGPIRAKGLEGERQ